MSRLIAGAAFAALLAAPALAGPALTPLVSTDWLAENLGEPDLLVLDLRPRAGFEAGHIAGSVQSDYPGAWRTISWALPETDALASMFSDLGIDADTSVVIVPAGTDASELGGATWAYWVLSYLGHDEVAILDGGFRAWSEEARASEQGASRDPDNTSFVPELRPEIRAETGDVEAMLGTSGRIVDARPASAFAAGHIPGALSIPYANLFDQASGRLLAPDALRLLLPPALADAALPVVTYCNTGHWGSIDWFVLSEVLGYPDVRLYDGSWTAWVSDAARPVETGP